MLKDTARRDVVEKRIAEDRALNKKAVEYLTSAITSEKGKQLLAETERLRPLLGVTNDQAIALAKAGKEDEAAVLITGEDARDKRLAYRSALQALVDYQKTLAKASSVAGKENSENANMWMLIIAAVAIGILIGIALMVIRGVSAAIDDIVRNVTQVVRDMRFTTRLSARKDELNQVSTSFNSLLGSLEAAVNDANRVIGAIADGDFSKRITNSYVGDLEQLKQGINSSAENVSCVMRNLQDAMHALKSGHFAFAVETAAPGSYGDMLTNVQQSMSELNGMVQDINHVMGKLNAGEFDLRVMSAAEGDLLQMKTAVNATLDTLDHLTEELVRMAQAQMEGDLTIVSTGHYVGRFAQLQAARRSSTEKMIEVVTMATQASMVVSDAAAQVSQGSSDLSSRVQEQASALEETSATMHEMTSAVQANTDNAAKVAHLAQEVQQKSTEGAAVMQQTIAAMQSIQDSSNKIADIVSIIDSIAFQTNLLALNAAVEAARAGEHGRGFAVVASEVRALAGKSAEAAKEIKGLIEESVERINSGAKLADKSGDMLGEISQSAGNVAAMIESISHASQEQTTGISQVHLAVADIDRVTQENAALVEETTAAAESMSHEATTLMQTLAFFKTGHHVASVTPVVSPVRSGAAVARKPLTTKSVAILPPATDSSDTWHDF